jgi:SAM-dependent methyltransferase
MEGAPKTATFHSRPHIVERAEYKATVESEVPMLRVLNNFILGFFSQHEMKEWKVLDAGCGRQPFRRLLEEKGCAYSAMDVNQNPEGSVQFICAIDEELPACLLQQGPFDLIICLEVMEHVADWDAAFKNFHLLLKNGGKLLLTAPFFFRLHEAPFDFWRPTPHSFEYYAQRHQLKVDEVMKGGDAWDILGTMLTLGGIYSRDRNFFNRLLSFCIRNFVRMIKGKILSGYFSRRVILDNGYYLSNGIVMHK